MVVAERQGVALPVPDCNEEALLAERRACLAAWQRLDALLLERVPPQIVCFGAGEAAGLLRAYAPAAWTRVQVCATDTGAGTGAMFGDRPHVPLEQVASESTVLVGVRPQDQPAIATRLRSRFSNVVTWYDLVPSNDAG